MFDIRFDPIRRDEGWRTVEDDGFSNFDLYRLTGEAAPGSDVVKYKQWLQEAYRSVVGIPERPGVDGAEAVEHGQADDDGPRATETVMTLGGRQVAVEMG